MIDWNRTIVVKSDQTVNICAGRQLMEVFGRDGHDGNGIDRVVKESVVDDVATFVIYYTDGTTSEFTIESGGASIDEILAVTDLRYALLNHDHDTRYYTKTLARETFAMASHNHDGRYATRDELDDLLYEKADAIKETGAFTDSGNSVVYRPGNTVTAITLEMTPYQSGSGTPSADNIRPIEAMKGLSVTGTNMRTENRVWETGSTFVDGSGFMRVFGGSYNVETGVMLIKYGEIASYNGESLPGIWWSDRDEYAPGTTPTTGAQVVYELATPTSYSGSPFPYFPFPTSDDKVEITVRRLQDDGSGGQVSVITKNDVLTVSENGSYPVDTQTYVDTKLSDAPNDGKLYGRQNGQWVEIV